MLLAKSAKLQDAASKAWCPGVLSLYPNKISWQPSSAAPPVPPDLHIGLISITNTQRAKGKPLLRLSAGTSVHMFEFATEADRDVVVDRYTKAKEDLSAQARARDRAAANAIPTSASSAAGRADEGGSASTSAQGRQSMLPSKLAWSGPLPSAVQKREIIVQDPEIGERYNSLVAASGVLTEDEFWASVMAEKAKSATASAAAGVGSGSKAASGKEGNKLPLLAPIPGQPEQKKGLSNAMFHVPVEQDGRSVAMRFTLTPDLIAMVFAEKPHVRRAYDKNVPTNMSEKEFWTRYLKNEMAKEERRKRLQQASSSAPGASSEASAVLAPTQAGEHARLFAEDENGAPIEDGNARRVRRKVLKTADPTVNLEADQGDGFSEGFGLLHAASKEPVAKAGFRAMAEELARDINRHANVVLGGARTLEQQPAGSKSGTRSAAAAPPTSASSPATVAAAESASTSVAQGSAASRKLQGEEALDELAAARLHGYGAGLEDLRAPKPLQYEVLRITDPRAYFDRLAATTSSEQQQCSLKQGVKSEPDFKQEQQRQQGGGEAGILDTLLGVPGQSGMSRCLQLLSAVDPNNLPCPPVSSYYAYEALLDVCGLTGDDGDAVGDSAAMGKPPPGLAQPPDIVLAPQLLSKFRTQVKIVADIARHFWACMPADTPEKMQKADRLASHVDSKLWPEVDHAITTANRMGGATAALCPAAAHACPSDDGHHAREA
eukprot:CAMPEP_0202388604 /NCGR_PEP_ID=MMETSP1127-20130417/78499_1 /ASSEMBLY_ACC=CAM_ASM_000462 /TAXON_ID=3047 /ORGANISM="Dunaliella tertiolecta, Strain CCMP1320" /LENGTH=719 /DNA_ID=CAMNT_0048990077 /DNA_START=104 /DNA_END=2262 /DNA_ORIENTATION=+